VKVDCAGCHHVALLTPEALLRVGLSWAAKVLDLKGRSSAADAGGKGGPSFRSNGGHKAREGGSPQFVQKRLRLLQIGRVEPLGEPAMDRRKELAGLGAAAWSRRSRARLAAARNSQSLASCSRAMLRALP